MGVGEVSTKRADEVRTARGERRDMIAVDAATAGLEGVTDREKSTIGEMLEGIIGEVTTTLGEGRDVSVGEVTT